MATNCTFEWTGHQANGIGSTISKVVSMADVVVNTTPTATGGWNTATVTADVARSHVMAESDGVPAGRYEKTSTGNFRLMRP